MLAYLYDLHQSLCYPWDVHPDVKGVSEVLNIILEVNNLHQGLTVFSFNAVLR